ncbi:MAG: TlpA family protein disulfide reductase [Desulfamplus sp.]|nr:TlpA family protein disulfide reductase [Desulfamplus sp.]MBF0258254.1 TlpA family protein disulfide reductase [Desulfamplus sp.]
MKNTKLFIAVIVCLLSVSIVSVTVSLADQIKSGGFMPNLSLPVPSYQGGKKELGLSGDMSIFTIADFKSDFVLIEVIGVYCPQCFKQAPSFNKLYGRLNKGKTKGRVTMFAIAAGGTDPEIEQLVKSGQYVFPVVSDMKYEAHKALGEPKTPFTIICRTDGAILYTHLGVVDDIDTLYGQIKGFLSQP